MKNVGAGSRVLSKDNVWLTVDVFHSMCLLATARSIYTDEPLRGVWNQPIVVSQGTRRNHQPLTSMLSPIANSVRWPRRRYHSDMPATVQPRGESDIVTSAGSDDHSLW